MSTTSPNFNLVLPATSDAVSVTSHISNNLSTLDSIFAVAHTGTGQLKSSLTIQTPTLVSPTISGNLSAATVSATVGAFSAITATTGSLSVSTFSIGTYSFPGAVGATGQILTVQTGNLVFANNSPGTGADTALNNLAAVNINTSLNSFTASNITLATAIAQSVTATAGTLTGLTNVNATTGTFAANLTVVGTLNAGALVATGGSITAGSLSIGTYAYPTTVGSSGQVMVATASGVVFGSLSVPTAISFVTQTSFAATNAVSVSIETGKTYRLMFEAVGSGTTPLTMRVNNIASTNYSYSYMVVGGTGTSVTTQNTIQVTTGQGGRPVYMDVVVNNSTTSYPAAIYGNIVRRESAGGTADFRSIAAYYAAATAVTSININATTNMSGTLTLYAISTS